MAEHLKSSLFILFVNFMRCLSSQTTVSCAYFNESDQCTGAISATTVYSLAYNGIYGSSTTVESSTTIDCYASFACDSIFALSAGSIEAYGANSVSNVSPKIAVSGEILLYGSDSALGSKIGIGEFADMYCGGSTSCSHTQIDYDHNDGEAKIYARAAYSLYNSTIVSEGSMFLYSEAYYALYDTTLKCSSPDGLCDIYCETRGACVGLKLECTGICNVYDNDTSTVQIIPIDMRNYQNSNAYFDSMCSQDYSFDENEENMDGSISVNGHVVICCRYVISIRFRVFVHCSTTYPGGAKAAQGLKLSTNTHRAS